MAPVGPAFIVDYVRTPIGRLGGGLASVRTDDLAAVPIAALLERNPVVAPAAIDDVQFGATNQAGEDNRNVARMAALLAGLPAEVPGATTNRLCGSGMEALVNAARAVAVGDAELVIAGGVESMSRAPWVLPKSAAPGDEPVDTMLGWRLVNPRMAEMGHTDALGVTAENVAVEFGVSRADQDAFALRSQRRTDAAVQAGWFGDEIVPVTTPGGAVVDADEHPRPEVTAARLAELAPAFVPGGTVTAGNSSGINDGAAAMLVASAAALERHGLDPMVRIAGSAIAGVPPRIMGVGPVPATGKLLGRAGLELDDVDVVEINEAFASQALASLRRLGLPDDADHVNPNGGAIALGHPTGMSGARIAGTAARELRRRSGRRALATMCIGVGQGIAVLLETV